MSASTEQLTLDFLTRRAALRESAPAQGLAVENISEQQYREVLKSQQPAITTWAFSPQAKAGQRVFVNLWVANPSASLAEGVNVTLFFGAAGFVSDAGQAVGSRRLDWPYQSQRVTLPQGQRATRLRLDYRLPSKVAPGCYFGNLLLWQGRSVWSRAEFWTQVG